MQSLALSQKLRSLALLPRLTATAQPPPHCCRCGASTSRALSSSASAAKAKVGSFRNAKWDAKEVERARLAPMVEKKKERDTKRRGKLIERLAAQGIEYQPGLRRKHDEQEEQDDEEAPPPPTFLPRPKKKAPDPSEPKLGKLPKAQLGKKTPVVPSTLALPPYITVAHLAKALGMRMRSLQATMSKSGFTDLRPDLLLSFDDAALLSAEYGMDGVPLDASSADYDIYPTPPLAAEQRSGAPLRPPVVTIMGHVDHGKTTLMDKLRSASVAAGEAGGITQHIGAFSVPVASRRNADGSRDTNAAASSEGVVDTVTFLDTPGHAAFSAMRGRGAAVTDIVVLVVAADDGVMLQTREVIELVESLREEEETSQLKRNAEAKTEGEASKQGGLQLVVAISKTDKPDAEPDRVRRELLAAGVQLEEFGGDVPCVEVSGKTGAGLPELEETLAALAEMADLRAERKDVPPEGFIIESKVDKARGTTATVLVKRGSLGVGDVIVAGRAYSKVRALLDAGGRPIKGRAMPGDPVVVTGWRKLPKAGDEVLGVFDSADGTQKAEQLAKKAVMTRDRVEERRRHGLDVESINENRRQLAAKEELKARREFEERKRKRELREAEAAGVQVSAEEYEATLEAESEEAAADADVKELRLVVKADFSGTIEAVVGAISGIGNADVRVKIVSEGVGEPTDGDVAMAQAVGGHVLGFNVKASRGVLNVAARSIPPVQVHCDDVIYRLMQHVSKQCAELLPPTIETRVLGEATIAQVFKINTQGRQFRNVAGCRVVNGSITANATVRVLRGGGGGADADGKTDAREVVWSGKLDSLKQGKKEVDEIRKGTECGLSFEGFEGFEEGDTVQSFSTVEVPRSL